MANYWCANFDGGDILDYGISINSWLMQYQYGHGGFEYQGNSRQRSKTTETWKSLPAIEIGDWVLAYLRGNAFFAAGQICSPRKLKAKAVHTDTVERTLQDKCHLYFDGIVRYADAEAYYEDFTDDFRVPGFRNYALEFAYSQRIDVTSWKHVVPDGITKSGLSVAAPLPEYRKTIFQIPAEFFHSVLEELKVASV